MRENGSTTRPRAVSARREDLADTGESRVLADALREGLIDAEVVDQLGESIDRWGARLGSLIHNGRISPQWAAARLGDARGGDARRRPRAVAPGRRLAQFRVDRLVSQGGMGTVYEAYDESLARRVALKILRRDDPAQTDRFLREARAQAQVEHDNVCRIFETGEVDGVAYIAMQYIDGEPLFVTEGLWTSPGPYVRGMTVEQKVALAAGVADGLHAAHRQGLIHRDVKPSNILVERTPEGGYKPYVVDFGLARDVAAPGLTCTGLTSGTPQFMAPEQARGRTGQLDRRTDVYGLGATLYAILAGRPPFEAESTLDVLVKVTEEEAPALSDAPLDLAVIVSKCLEKEPAARYGSVREVAGELRRYLDGEPIRARRQSLVYRLWRKAKKHRAVVSVSSAALLAVVAMGGVSLRSHLAAGERARLAQAFGREVERMETVMRLAHLSPRHELTADKWKVRQQMVSLRQRAADGGRPAEGPGSYALGRGHLALGELEPALVELERAWERGYRGPEVAHALAEALGGLYRRELQRADRLADAAERQAHRERARSTYRDPALRFLELGRGAEVESIPLVEAQLALLEGRDDEALGKAAEAYASLPWLFEARRLEGDVYSARAAESLRQGDGGAARRWHGEARASYLGALEIAESAPQVYESLCSLERTMMAATYLDQSGVDDAANRGLEACRVATTIDPESSIAFALMVEIGFRLGELDLRRGRDPRPHLERAVESAERALDLDPDRAETHRDLGSVHVVRGRYASRHGEDPIPHFEAAIAAYRQAVALNPNSVGPYNNLSVVHQLIAQHVQGRGGDPRPSLLRSIESLRGATAADPDLWMPHVNLGTSFSRLAYAGYLRGEDPRSQLEQAIDAYAKALALNPQGALIHHNAGLAHLRVALWERDRGVEATESLRRSETAYSRAVEINGELWSGYLGLAQVHQQRAAQAASRGGDPREHLERSSESTRRALEINPDAAGALRLEGAAHLLRAEHALMAAADAQPSIERAIMAFQRSLAIDAGSALGATGLGEAHHLSARLDRRRSRDPRPALALARQSAAHAVDLNPSHQPAFVLLARLAATEARSLLELGIDPSSRLAEGLGAIDRAIAIKPDATAYTARAELLRWQVAANEPPDREAHDIFRGALSAADEAIARNPVDARAHAARAALVLLRDGGAAGGDPPAEARASLRRALELNPLLRSDLDPALAPLLG